MKTENFGSVQRQKTLMTKIKVLWISREDALVRFSLFSICLSTNSLHMEIKEFDVPIVRFQNICGNETETNFAVGGRRKSSANLFNDY